MNLDQGTSRTEHSGTSQWDVKRILRQRIRRRSEAGTTGREGLGDKNSPSIMWIDVELICSVIQMELCWWWATEARWLNPVAVADIAKQAVRYRGCSRMIRRWGLRDVGHGVRGVLGVFFKAVSSLGRPARATTERRIFSSSRCEEKQIRPRIARGSGRYHDNSRGLTRGAIRPSSLPQPIERPKKEDE